MEGKKNPGGGSASLLRGRQMRFCLESIAQLEIKIKNKKKLLPSSDLLFQTCMLDYYPAPLLQFSSSFSSSAAWKFGNSMPSRVFIKSYTWSNKVFPLRAQKKVRL
jgi:hypothetical protein